MRLPSVITVDAVHFKPMGAVVAETIEKAVPPTLREAKNALVETADELVSGTAKPNIRQFTKDKLTGEAVPLEAIKGAFCLLPTQTTKGLVAIDKAAADVFEKSGVTNSSYNSHKPSSARLNEAYGIPTYPTHEAMENAQNYLAAVEANPNIGNITYVREGATDALRKLKNPLLEREGALGFEATIKNQEALLKDIKRTGDWRTNTDRLDLENAYFPTTAGGGVDLSPETLGHAVAVRDTTINPEAFVQANGYNPLENANLSGAYFIRTKVKGGSMAGTDFSGAKITESELKEVDLSNSNLKGASINQKTTIEKVNLSGANLGEAHINSSTIKWGRTDNLNLEKAKMHNAQFAGTALTDESVVNVQGLELTGDGNSSFKLDGFGMIDVRNTDPETLNQLTVDSRITPIT